MCATGVLMAAPMVAFGLLVQRHLVRGLTAGALKG
jgi:ABC-type glycerol-3-phosphate transport system permease component